MIRIREYRDKEFIDRENEIEYLKSWFKNTPDEILWLFGPKSTGKTTLIEYVVENYLLKSSEYNVKYINFRGKMVGNYDNFISSFIRPDDKQFLKDIDLSIDLKVIKINSKLYEKIKKKEYDFFEAMEDQFLKLSKNRKNILIIDEIQTLEDIYINGGKLLLKEFLNFCVRLTKELHISHVVILSSNTIFLDRIYNDAKLKVTSRFKKIDHLDKETTLEYLRYKTEVEKVNFTEDDLELIWEYLGGCIPLLQRVFREIKGFNSLKEYLESEAELAVSEVVDIMVKILNQNEKDIFEKILGIILKNGNFIVNKDEKRETMKIVDFMAEKEILFYDPLTREIKGNNRLYEKGFEKLMSSE